MSMNTYPKPRAGGRPSRAVLWSVLILAGRTVYAAPPQPVGRDSDEIRSKYRLLGDVYRRKAFDEAFRVVERSYYIVGGDGVHRRYSDGTPDERRFLAHTTRLRYDIVVRRLVVTGATARAEVAERGLQERRAGGWSYLEGLGATSSDVWRRRNGAWRLAYSTTWGMSVYPLGRKKVPIATGGGHQVPKSR